MFYFDSSYFVFVLPALLFAMYANSKVKSTYRKYANTYTRSGVSAAEVASRLLRRGGAHDVQVSVTQGELTDHYDPKKKIVNLSQSVYNNSSLAALGIAAHEVGHAFQHKEGYAPLAIRNSIVPVAQLGTSVAFPMFFIGLFVGINWLLNIGIILFIGAVVFQIVTLPVEFNASKRAIALLQGEGFLSSGEIKPVKEVLNAAALTYVAATAMAIAQLLRLLALSKRRR